MNLNIKGVDKVIQWFGQWPSFHDAEITELHLDRYAASLLKIHTWNTKRETDEKSHYKTDKHAVVIFTLTKITDLELYHFGQNVIGDLDIEQTQQGYKIIMKPCYGLYGFLEAKDLTLDVLPGKPKIS